MPTNNNSIKNRDKKPDVKQFDGVTNLKKVEQKSILRWIGNMFFSGKSVKDVCKEVVEQQIVPGMRDNFRNSIVSSLDMLIYKDNQIRPSTPSSPTTSFVTDYVRFSNPTRKSTALQQEEKKNEDTIKQGFGYPAFATKQIALTFLNEMKMYVQKYDQISVHTLAYMQKKDIDYVWDAWGWEKQEIMAINEPTHVSNNPQFPWVIILPKAHELADNA